MKHRLPRRIKKKLRTRGLSVQEFHKYVLKPLRERNVQIPKKLVWQG